MDNCPETWSLLLRSGCSGTWLLMQRGLESTVGGKQFNFERKWFCSYKFPLTVYRTCPNPPDLVHCQVLVQLSLPGPEQCCPFLGKADRSLQKSSPWGHVLLPGRLPGLPDLVTQYLLTILPGKAVLLISLVLCLVVLCFESETISFNSFWERQTHLCVVWLNIQAAELQWRHWSVLTVEIAFRKQIRDCDW